ncbi:hypothetical protein B0H15DRAFT_831927 [Mycena belliarum]|uniref:F-box domain-containing protein n=1 Tax=Mycena belliarum TaxID=1033014 RepID=A0AAD6U9V1_9AGAR|nr:hypothetical protein B0H15DRAFT_831927 [Mycena belliae]
MSTPTRDEVLATPELLENILAQLPMRALLLRAPLVCKMWLATTRAPALQRALFFLPDPDPPSSPSSSDPDPDSDSTPDCAPAPPPVLNPLLVEMFPPFFLPLPPRDCYTWPTAHDILAMPAATSPAAFARRGASWRRMLVVQPAVRVLRVVQRAQARGGDFERCATVELQGEGLRMGALYDLAAGGVERAGAAFRVTWHGEVGREVDVTLETVDTMQFVDGRAGPFTEEFLGHGEGPRLEFRGWMCVLREF